MSWTSKGVFDEAIVLKDRVLAIGLWILREDGEDVKDVELIVCFAVSQIFPSCYGSSGMEYGLQEYLRVPETSVCRYYMQVHGSIKSTL